MKDIAEKLRLLSRDEVLKRKIYFTLAIFLFFRIFAFLPVSVINLTKLKALFDQSQFLSLLDIFSHCIPDVVGDNIHRNRLELIFHISNRKTNELFVDINI